jgi:hypothetical protein
MMKGGRRLSDGTALYWWVEILAILGFYILYSVIRNANGSHPLHAFHDAQDIIKLEHHLGIFHEATIQRWALHCKPLIITANYMYGSLHFIVTIWVAVWLFRSYSDDYPRYRNTLAVTTFLALIGFSFFPLMPPRLLHEAGLPSDSSTPCSVIRPFGRSTPGPPHASPINTRPCRACTLRGPLGARSPWSRA